MSRAGLRTKTIGTRTMQSTPHRTPRTTLLMFTGTGVLAIEAMTDGAGCVVAVVSILAFLAYLVE